MFDCIDSRRTPAWYRTPLAQTVTLGVVFFFVFASYTTIQFYARTTYGEKLAANSVSAVYASFTVACLFAPSVANKIGSRFTMFLGILGYAALVAASFLYFLYGDKMGPVVVAGGVILGCGAALLWTGQGRLLLQYAAEAERINNTSTKIQSGTLMGVFWAVFQCSSLVGGTISFIYYSHKPSGSVILYTIFLAFILLGALSTQLLLPPSMLQSSHDHKRVVENGQVVDTSEETMLLHAATHPLQIEEPNTHELLSDESWLQQATKTLSIFFTKPMLNLSILFFYTGFNQPYQQATFGNRFFTKRTIGAELIVFHLMEIVGALYCGRALDGNSTAEKNKEESESGGETASGRHRSAVSCIVLFVIVNTVGNALAFFQEYLVLKNGTEALDILDVRSFWPSLAFACWGFADSQIQVYCYWLIGTQYSSGDDHCRAVGFYKCIQSLGVSIGFYLTPLSRLSALTQLWISSGVYVIGTGLALLQLPK
jgi:MFS family permease